MKDLTHKMAQVDCETCIHNKGALECDMYGCKYEPILRSWKVRKSNDKRAHRGF